MSNEKHPADEIGKAINRASGILSSLNNCFDVDDGQFALGNSFVFDAINNVEKLLHQAGEALRSLYEGYDLTALQNHQPVESAPTPAVEAAPSSFATGVFRKPVPAEVGGDQVARLSKKLEMILDTMPSHGASTQAAAPARTYGELLDRLSAAAHIAGQQDNPLMPVLEELKADMLRLRSVA